MLIASGCGFAAPGASAAPPGPLLLDARGGFDSYHNLASGDGFAGFRGLATAEGFSLVSRSTFTEQGLQGAAALILLQPYSRAAAYTGDEINAIEAFARGGGRVLVLGDGGSGSEASDLNDLSAAHGVTYAATASDALGATIDQFVSHALTTGLTSVAVDYQRRLTSTSPAFDLTVPGGASDFLAVSGTWVFLSDSSLFMDADDFSDASLTDRSNGTLARNLLHLLATPPGQVLGRRVFYNRSVWDGNNDAANASDDAAIAPDKTALRPGQKATFANYTSYPRGLNGILIDVAHLPGIPTAADFIFRTGNTPDPSGWSNAPAPAEVTIRPGAGTGGSDRIAITWRADAVKKAWLQVSMLATPTTGLPAPDVFYFGNAIGETGNSTSDARVTSADALRVLSHVTVSATLGDPYDLNRDGRVAAADRLLVLGNLAAVNPLILLDLTAAGDQRTAEAGNATVPAMPATGLAEKPEPSGPVLHLEFSPGGEPVVRCAGLTHSASEVDLESSLDGTHWDLASGWRRRNRATGPEWWGSVATTERSRFLRLRVRPDE